jgi:hypothetical protein
MAPPLSHQIEAQLADAAKLYHRLVLVVGPGRSGKTSALMELEEEHDWPLVNVNLALSKQLLELTVQQRRLRAAGLLSDVVEGHDNDIVLLDNLEMLFHPELKQDPLRLLHRMSRNRTIIATWRGQLHGQSLTYASPEHPEYRRYDDPQALTVVTTDSFPVSGTTASPQE